MKKYPLNKRHIRDLKQNTGRYIAISIMIILSIMSLSGILSAYDAIKGTINNNREECFVEDADFQTIKEIDSNLIQKIEQENDIKIYKNYYQNFEKIKNSNGKENEDAIVRIFSKRQDINVQSYLEGRAPEEKDEIAIDRIFAESNNLNVNNEISIASKKYKITGFISLPDYATLFNKNTDIVMDTFNFCVGIVSSDCFRTFDTEKNVYNYSLRFSERNLDEDQKSDKNNDIKDALLKSDIKISGYLPMENNQAISFPDDDLGTSVPLLRNFSLMIIVIMAFVFSIIVASTVDSEAKIIGTLLSLGYKKREIIFHYLKTPLIISAISALLGNILGYTVMPKVYLSIFNTSYSIPKLESIKINSDALFLSTVVPLALIFIINAAFLCYKMTLSPLKFLRNDLKRHRNRRGIKLPEFKFFNRFRIRIILQNKASYIMLLIGILLGNIILLFGLMMMPTIDKYVDDIKDTAASNYQYILKMPEESSSSSAEKIIIEPMKVKECSTEKNVDVSMYGIKTDSKYFDSLKFTAGDKDSVYVSEGLFKKLKLNKSDKITLKDSNTGKSYELTVKDTVKYDSGFAVFMNDKCLNELFGNNKEFYNGYLSNEELDISDNNIASMITVSDMQSAGKQMVKVFKGMRYVIDILAVIVFIVLMYVMTKIVIEKNAINISYLKVFGYKEKEISRLYITSTTIVVLISAVISLPISYKVLNYVFITSMSKINGYIEPFVPGYDYLILIAITLICYKLVNLSHIKKVNNIKMTEALKNRE